MIDFEKDTLSVPTVSLIVIMLFKLIPINIVIVTFVMLQALD